MANTNTKRILADGPKNAVVELVGVLDTDTAGAPFSVAPAIDLSVDFVNNDAVGTLVGLRIDEIQYSISDNLTARLFWDATADQVIAALAGRGKVCLERYNGLQPNRAAAGYTGDIDLTVDNIVINADIIIQGYTLLLSMTKLYDV